jgi:exodeoxyribonuclease VII large subunit
MKLSPVLLPQSEIFTVGQVVQILRDVLSHAMPAVRFQGELGPVTRASSGHVYFTIKDSASTTPQILNAVMWKGVASTLEFKPTEGLLVECRGAPTIYPASGRLQVVISSMQAAGDGALRMQFERLKLRLSEEGLFTSERKRELPFFPEVIGVVSSRTGSVIHDIAVTVNARMPGTIIFLAHAKVQGDGAADEIVKAIRRLNENEKVEVIIIARGGGSLEDLWAFNEEAVVRAIFASKKPVISAIGHEVDITLADLVADVRAPTPTGAARIVVPDRVELLQRVSATARRLEQVNGVLQGCEQRLDLMLARFFEVGKRKIENNRQKITLSELRLDRCRPALRLQRFEDFCDHALVKLQQNLTRCIARGSARLNLVNQDLVNKVSSSVPVAQRKIEKYETLLIRTCLQAFNAKQEVLFRTSQRLRAFDPNKVLERGYSMVTTVEKGTSRVVAGVGDVKKGSKISIRMKDGELDATIT